MTTLESIPASFTTTRDSLHALAEQVIAPARYQHDHHIGLHATPGGFGTPQFGDHERVRVDGVELVHERPGSTQRIVITTLAAGAQFIGTPLGVPNGLYTPATHMRPDEPLVVAADAVRVLAAWLAFATSVLEEVRALYAAHSPSGVQMWPEHFDMSCDFGEANYGASLGDGAITQPYLYVGPWDEARRTGVLGIHPFGAACQYDELAAVPDARAAALEFFFDCAALLVGAP
jgi:hypothetical protein